jgi:uncharacterized protein YdhG (YjbR/CyaY superfamily)
MQSKAETIAAYMSELPPKEKSVIQSLDRLVRFTLKGAVGTMKFGMPTYDADGRMIAINAQKNYFSLYVDPAVMKRYSAELEGLSCGKCCIRFRKMEDLPIDAIRSIIAEHAAQKPAT